MLFYAILILSLLSGGAAAVSTGFDLLSAVLLFLGAALGSFIVFWLLAALILWLICLPVDQTKPQTEDSPLYRKLAAVYISGLIRLLRIRIHTKGLEQIPTDGRFFLVSNHLFIADPAFLLHVFPRSQLSFVTKKENQKLPFVGPIMHKILCQPIDRNNDRASLKGILNCIKIIQEDKASVAIFPEGGTSKDGKLHHFRAGAFKIAQRTKVPVVVCTLQNTRPIFHNALRFRPTDVELHLVKVIQPEEYAGMNTVQMTDMAYEIMLEDLGDSFRTEETHT
ncbi:MAG: 1-acyl-sn-glycerol-3-phosphate acyltransferase [Oscillospiraceae bacterium]|nr:1-acyl-sn-glycerol-3-phosphate acyltransferase [Oscillospiraceae bacterium]